MMLLGLITHVFFKLIELKAFEIELPKYLIIFTILMMILLYLILCRRINVLEQRFNNEEFDEKQKDIRLYFHRK